MFGKLIEAIWNKDKSFESELNYKTLNGDEFSALFSVPIPQTKTKQKNVPVSIQKLKDAKIAKRESLDKLNQAQKLAHIGSWQFNTVNRGKDGLEYLNKNTCDIVFTDIGMPEMNGWELAKAIRDKFGNNKKIVIVSGWAVEETTKKEHGIDFVLQKPFTLKDLENIFLNV